MTPRIRIAILVAATAALAGGAFAQSAVEGAIKARKAHMGLFAFNLGQLGAMAKGEVPYDAAQASAAAGNLVSLAGMNLAAYFPTGSAQGEAADTRALPAIWQDGDGVTARIGALREAAAGLSAAAGTDLAALQGAMGPVGEACGACHKAYRAPD